MAAKCIWNFDVIIIFVVEAACSFSTDELLSVSEKDDGYTGRLLGLPP